MTERAGVIATIAAIPNIRMSSCLFDRRRGTCEKSYLPSQHEYWIGDVGVTKRATMKVQIGLHCKKSPTPGDQH